jgi:putative ABC transport system substrate-binding protein
MIRRREFITLLGGAAAWPLVARAQQTDRRRRIGVLMGFAETDWEARSFQQAFSLQMKELGWIDGDTARFEYRWAAGEPAIFKAYADELIALKPDVILANTSPAARVLRKETTTIPIVFVQVADPVGQGIVSNLAHPGGNVTGFNFADFPFGGKWLEVLKEIAPRVERVAIIYNPQTSAFAPYFQSLQSAAASLAMEMVEAPVRDDGEIERAIAAMGERAGGGLSIMADPFTAAHRVAIIESAARHRVPAIYHRRVFVSDGGLIAYGPDVVELFRSAANYVNRILRGEKVGDLPVQNPTKYSLAINLKTARALRIEVPPTLLARADEVIE